MHGLVKAPQLVLSAWLKEAALQPFSAGVTQLWARGIAPALRAVRGLAQLPGVQRQLQAFRVAVRRRAGRARRRLARPTQHAEPYLNIILHSWWFSYCYPYEGTIVSSFRCVCRPCVLVKLFAVMLGAHAAAWLHLYRHGSRTSSAGVSCGH